jgi:hypothetical protein
MKFELVGTGKIREVNNVDLNREKELDVNGDGDIIIKVKPVKINDKRYVVLYGANVFYPNDVYVGDSEDMDNTVYLNLTHIKGSATTAPYIEVHDGLLGSSNNIYVVYDASNDNGVDIDNSFAYDDNTTNADTDVDNKGLYVYYYNGTTDDELIDQTTDDYNNDENKYHITDETIELTAEDRYTVDMVVPDQVRDAVLEVTGYSVTTQNETTGEETTTKELTEGQEINGVKVIKIEGQTCEAQATEPKIVLKEGVKLPTKTEYEEKTIDVTKPIDFDPSDLIAFAETGTYTIYVGTSLTNPELAKFKGDFIGEGGLEKAEVKVEGNNLYVVGGSPDAVYEAAKEVAKLLRNE